MPVHTAVWLRRASGALVMVVAVQVSVPGLYLPPVLNGHKGAVSAPDDHFTVGPHCRVIDSCGRRIGGIGSGPAVGAGIVSAASVKIPRCQSAPDDHFTAGPHCRVISSGSGRVGRAGGCPTVGTGIISAAGVQIGGVVIKSAPDDHFAVGPHCRVTSRAGASVVLVAVQLSVLGLYLPPVFNHSVQGQIAIRPRRSFRCRSTLPCGRLGQRARWWCWWLSNCLCRDCIFRLCLKLPRHARPRRSFRYRSTLPCDPLGQRARWWCWWLSNYPCWDCISRRCLNTYRSPQTIISLPVHTAV